MWLVDLVTALALFQFLLFGALVGRARGKYGVKAPAVSGNEMFERYFRVQMNTLEQMVVFIPALWVASRYWNPAIMAAIGSVYLLGRVIYLQSYVSAPEKRGTGFILTILPSSILVLASLAGVMREGLK